jgi:NADH:ubiquinone oxidoreductase subunit 2 (subunit N)
MIELELFQMYHLREMSLSAELFLSCSILQFTFYAISTAYQRKAGFVILNKQVYYIGTLLIVLSSFLILNEDLLVMNSFTSNNFIINDYLGFATKLVICLTSVLFLLIINISFRDEPIQNNFEYVVLITISILGLLLLCSSNDLITAYLSIELQSIAFYIMSAFKRNSSYSIESGLKYFIIGSLSSAFFLFGSSIVYGCTGSLSFDDLQMFFSLFFSPESDKLATSFNYSSYLESETESYSKYLCVALADLNDHTHFAQSTPTPATANLASWCYLNEQDSLSSVIPSTFWVLPWLTPEEIVLGVIILFQHIPTEVAVSAVYDEILWNYLNNTFDQLSPLWSFSNVHAGNSEESLLLLKQISECYSNTAFDGLTHGLPALNLDFVSIGFMLICISILIKLSIAPFHFWSLDVYEGSPNATTFFFSVVPKIGLFVLLMRLCYISFYQIFIDNYQIYFFLLAVLSVFVGSFGGLEQRKLKTLLAYSSISHTGYLLLSFSTGNVEGIQMMFYYLVIYMISTLCFWSVYLFLRQKKNSYFNKSNKELGDLVLLKESNPMLALILALTLFSIAGIPPMVGFLAKIGVFLVVIKSSAYLIALFSILFSVVSTFYYIRLVKILYFENTLVGKLYVPINTQKSILISILALLLIILCVDPMIIYLLFYKATLLAS